MKSALRRDGKRRRPAFQTEFLEARELLSVAKPAALTETIHAAAVPAKFQMIKGRVGGTPASAGLFFQAPAGFTSYSGHGTASPLGFITYGNSQLQTLSSTTATSRTFAITFGSATIGTRKNETFFISYTGTAVAARSGKTTFTLTGVITGGTGRFSGVTGTFSATGSVAGVKTVTSFVLVPKYPAYLTA